jgi:hypothetical protein
VAQWNNGKREEFKLRKPFKLDPEMPNLRIAPWSGTGSGTSSPQNTSPKKDSRSGLKAVREIALEGTPG